MAALRPALARCSCGSFPLAVAGRKSKPISSSSLASAPPAVVCATRGSATTATSSACGELGRLQSCTRRAGIEGAFLREVGQDLSYALRLMRRSPAVVAIAVLGLGLAIGVSTSVFSFLNAVTFRPTGIVDPASTARVMRAYADGSGTSWRYSEYQLLRGGRAERFLDAWFRDDVSIGFVPDTETRTTTSVMFVTGGYLGA